MYRIVCESYKNYIKDFDKAEKDYRYHIMTPFELILDLDKYKKEKERETLKYKKLQDFIFLVKESIDDYPRFKSFLWTLESRGIKGKYYGVLEEEEFKEQVKIISMFLKLSYWT
ncbi:hypothetical protein [Caldisalinibacter kiritimatiensis]|uniref:Uncharacterized protein n=1 Tax=Caldisalinibacter kiritimatiensis TaxID=1304284 RepID=R1CKZ6_9FIRM|nr:hypothetical protein [Caldisalinibacter kiritimatiensis]EOC99385.1 hypothetical protein L21TH_2643 [Caldisalinibacter kiritimatiensis]